MTQACFSFLPVVFASKKFRVDVSTADLERIAWARTLYFDVETTALTRYSKPTPKFTRSTKIGHWTAKELHYAAHPDMSFAEWVRSADRRPRLRVVTLSDGEGYAHAWDLDLVSPFDRVVLLEAIARSSAVVVGHNVVFDLCWLVDELAYLNPSFDFESCQLRALDMILVFRYRRPQLAIDAMTRAYRGNRAAWELVRRRSLKFGSASLAVASLAFDGMPVDKRWQHARNWCVSELTDEHYAYCMGDVSRLGDMLERYVGEDWRDRLDEVFPPWFLEFSYALALMHRKGVPVHEGKAERLYAACLETIRETCDELAHVPEFVPFLDALRRPTIAMSAPIKRAIVTACAAGGVTVTEDRCGQPDMAVAGARKLPWFAAWCRLQAAKKAAATVQEWQELRADDGRVRSLYAPITATMRLASQHPNGQNLSKRKGVKGVGGPRSIVVAREGYKLISADLSQIELRIGAALCERALRAAREMTPRRSNHWFASCLCDPRNVPGETSFGVMKKQIAEAWAATEFGTKNELLRLYRDKVDIHLNTASGFVRRAGLDPAEALADTPENAEGRDSWRNRAKACNFGLLYGASAKQLWRMGVVSYGVDWTLPEAFEARETWFSTYPEVRFWLLWTKYVDRIPKHAAFGVCRPDDGPRSGEISKHCVAMTPEVYEDLLDENDRLVDAKVIDDHEFRPWRSSTLDGCPLVAEAAHVLANYTDQGTGARMAAEIIVESRRAGLPLISFVHDEALYEVRDDEVDRAKDVIAEIFRSVADRYLSPFDVPGGYSMGVHQHWDH